MHACPPCSYLTNVQSLDSTAGNLRQHALIDRHNAAVLRAAHLARAAVAQSVTGAYTPSYTDALRALDDVETLGQQIICERGPARAAGAAACERLSGSHAL